MKDFLLTLWWGVLFASPAIVMFIMIAVIYK
jgi:hypothetical protein